MQSLRTPCLESSLSEKSLHLRYRTCLKLKEQGHVTVNTPVISMIYIFAHMWPLCSAKILVDWENPQESYFQKSTKISAIVQYTSVSFVSLRKTRVHLQNDAFILRIKVENLCDMAYQRCCFQNRHFERSLFTLRDPAPLNRNIPETAVSLHTPSASFASQLQVDIICL